MNEYLRILKRRLAEAEEQANKPSQSCTRPQYYVGQIDTLKVVINDIEHAFKNLFEN